MNLIQFMLLLFNSLFRLILYFYLYETTLSCFSYRRFVYTDLIYFVNKIYENLLLNIHICLTNSLLIC
jgi:hypothetical protein